MPNGWTRDEVEAIVADYFAMLQAELSGKPYSKAEHNRGLQRRIGRNKSSIEFKHQNISAVLVNFRQPRYPAPPRASGRSDPQSHPGRQSRCALRARLDPRH